MDKKELALKIYEVSHLTGEFLLRSGKISNEYFDKYQFESDPELLNDITDFMLSLIDDETEILAGLETGGIPLATSISLKIKKPAIFVRKKAKDYGTKKLAEGLNFSNKNVLIIEDVVTTGGQIIKSALELRELGAVIKNVICVIVREDDAFENLRKEGLELKPLFSMKEIKNIVEETKFK